MIITGGKRKPIIEIGRGINNNLNISDLDIIDMLKAKRDIIQKKKT